MWETPEQSNGGDYDDREKVKFAIGLELEGTVVRVTERKPSTFGGEVRYVDLDTPDGRKVSFGVSGWRLDRFEPVGYQPGDGLRVIVNAKKTKDGKKTFGDPVFSIDRRGGQAPAPAPVPVADDDNPPF